MLILAKAAMALMLGFVLAIASGLIFIPLLKKLNVGQMVSREINARHLKKEGTPTMGGIIFIFPVILSLILLYLNESIEFSYNLFILIFVFLAYALIGGIDDFLKVRFKNNAGLSIVTKFLMQMIIALVFFYFFMRSCG